jgi:hypothetical protein
MSRFLLVEMEEDLASLYTTHDGVFISCKCVNGVRSVTDLASIDQTTLDIILLKPTPRVKREEPMIYNAIRRYHARRQQPGLPGG